MSALLVASLLSSCGYDSSKRSKTSADSSEDLKLFNPAALVAAIDRQQSQAKANAAMLRSGSLPKPNVRVENSKLIVNGQPYTIKGVCYAPRRKGMAPGETNSLIYQDASLADRDQIWKDIQLMREAHINTIRVYEPILDFHVLEMFHVSGIKIIQNVVINADKTPPSAFAMKHKVTKYTVEQYPYEVEEEGPLVKPLQIIRDHPTTLMIEVGNEWTLNYFYQSHEFEHDKPWHIGNAMDYLGQATAFVKLLAPKIPITSSVSGTLYNIDHGKGNPEQDKKDLLNGFKNVDVWGINTYDSFGHLDNSLTQWATWTQKPYYLSEFGADRWDSIAGVEKENFAAEAAGAYIDIMKNHLEILHPGQRGIGGTIFTFQDELWSVGSREVQEKPAAIDPEDLDTTPRLGIHGDGIFNEEYFGLLSNQRDKKFSAFGVVAGKYGYELP